jgi:ferrochelatase
MNDGVLLLAHGAPERIEDVGPYLTLVRGGRPLAPELVEEIRGRYRAIGGGSPLTARTAAQAAALEQRLAADGFPLPVRFGMRNWTPTISDAMAELRAIGVTRIVAICLAPQYSRFSIGLYFRRAQEAKTQLGYNAEILWAKSYHNHPLLIEAFAARLQPLLPAGMVLFTAHSLPEKILESADPYDSEARATARAVAERARLERWEFAYQSQGLTDEKWLGPTVESRIDEFARAGIRDLVLAPIGFVSDHVEILYDVDILFRDYAARRGIALRRPESLNDSPLYIAALADVVRQKLGVD